MPRFFSYMVLLGFVSLIAATVAFIRSPPSSPNVSSTGTFARKPVGDTAISHGGPSPTRSDAYAASPKPGTIAIGQEMMIGAPTVLHPAIPDETPASTPATIPPVPVGTVVTVVAIAPAVPPDTRQTTTYYKVQLVDGRTGWVSEHVLRPVTASLPPPPRP